TGGYDVALTDQTGGIFVGRAALNAFRLMEPKPVKPFENIETTFKFGRALWFTQSGYGGCVNDPLVLDLDGTGIRLTAESGAAPTFDMFATGFAVHTGWVQPSTGILVIENADGAISNIHNLVVSNNNSGFAALAQLETNH